MPLTPTQMAGEAFLELSPTHPWSPGAVPKDYKTTNYTTGGRPNAATNSSWHTFSPGNEGAHGGHYCYVPGLDFLLVHVHTYGLDRKDYWVTKVSTSARERRELAGGRERREGDSDAHET